MNRPASFVLGLLCAGLLSAAPVRVIVHAPTYAGEQVVLYRTLDLLTLRTEALAQATLDARGDATLDADVTGTVKGLLRIGTVSGELFLRAGSYELEMPAPDAGTPRSINGTTRVDPVFQHLDALDINALIADLNERLDGFVAEDLATDRAAGMQAVDLDRRAPADTVKRPGTLFVTPELSAARVDTFERKLRRFYADVKDPWFWSDLDYGVAGLRFGPRANDRELFGRYLKGRPVLYDVPEYIRFIHSFFTDHLMRYPFRTQEAQLTAAIRIGAPDSVKAVLAGNDFLRDDRLCELVLLHELHAVYWGKTFDRGGILRILHSLNERSAYPEHRTIAADMLWDLTAMMPGSAWPELRLEDAEGRPVAMDSLLTGAVCVAVTASWCTACERELGALDQLERDHGAQVRFVTIALERSQDAFLAYRKAHPEHGGTWLRAPDPIGLLDALRLYNVPAFFLLNDDRLVHAPAPLPSNGMAAILHRITVKAQEDQRIGPGREAPPPKR